MHTHVQNKNTCMNSYIRETRWPWALRLLYTKTHTQQTQRKRESQDAHEYEHARAHAYERAHAHTRTQTVLHTLGTGRLPRVSWPFRTAVSTADNGRAFQASNMA